MTANCPELLRMAKKYEIPRLEKDIIVLVYRKPKLIIAAFIPPPITSIRCIHIR